MESNQNKRMSAEEYNRRLDEVRNLTPDTTLPYTDPAIVNPTELASFPKPAPKASATDIAEENQAHPMSVQRSAVREGRNIVRTDTAPDPDGFL
ncbi:hypothetical protein ACLI08_14290 [Flavobacterium sp. RNTU_13]|uniref:hypothetical protein n=1 Tax=Flavobacterium sp. RNTU_13 TaxID=3375145 RepID=UPI003987B335